MSVLHIDPKGSQWWEVKRGGTVVASIVNTGEKMVLQVTGGLDVRELEMVAHFMETNAVGVPEDDGERARRHVN